VGVITNLYLKPIALTTPPATQFGSYGKIVVAPGKSIEWDGPDCFVSCDNPDHPEYYQNLPAATKENTYLAGEFLWHNVHFMINSGIESDARKESQRNDASCG
jgi:hypothetical protein